MAVYTELTDDAIRKILRDYPLGALVAAEPIAAGIENTNYFVDTEQGRFVLTIFERVDPQDLPYFLELMRHLAQRGIPAPAVVPRTDGALWFTHRGKHGCVITRLPGATQERLSDALLAQAARLLARMHLAAADFPRHRPSPTGLAWLARTIREIIPAVAARWGKEAARLLEEELAWQSETALERTDLPSGPIHGDLFVDNLLVCEGEISGVIDFYYAHNAAWLLDLAIATNALALDAEARGLERAALFLRSYAEVRMLEPAEEALLVAALRLAALRFWVSRLWDALHPREGKLTTIKDPEEYRRKLLCWRSPEAARWLAK